MLLRAMMCVALAACAGVPTRETALPATAAETQARFAVYVIKRGWHVDVGMATADVQPVLQPVSAAFAGSRYLLFGFGNRRYLLQRGGAVNLVAAVFPGPGLVMVTSLHAPQLEDVFGTGSVVRIALTPQQMSGLQAFIGRSLAAHGGALVPVAPGLFEGSAYYKAVQRYSALYTCNTWAAEALKAAQLSVDADVEFAWQLWSQVQHLASPNTRARSPPLAVKLAPAA